jgi:hypothetical protein
MASDFASASAQFCVCLTFEIPRGTSHGSLLECTALPLFLYLCTEYKGLHGNSKGADFYSPLHAIKYNHNLFISTCESQRVGTMPSRALAPLAACGGIRWALSVVGRMAGMARGCPGAWSTRCSRVRKGHERRDVASGVRHGQACVLPHKNEYLIQSLLTTEGCMYKHRLSRP